MSERYTLGKLADTLGVDARGDRETPLIGVSTLEKAGPQELSFLANPNYKRFLKISQAGAIILHPDQAENTTRPVLLSTNPYATWAKALTLIYPQSLPEPGIAPSASIHPTAQIHETASIGEHCVIEEDCIVGAHAVVGPQCVLEMGAKVGQYTRLVARVFVGKHCQLGDRVIIHPGVVIGADGFGIALDQGHWQKVPQLGCVVIGNDCEIGANTTIDRGALGNTVLGHDVRVDNQVQIAHNVEIGDHTAIAGCVGIAGSTTIGSYCMIAGACGIGGHIRITDQVIVTAMSTVLNSIESPGTYGSGIPAQPHQHWKRILVRLAKLDHWINRIKKLEKGSSSS